MLTAVSANPLRHSVIYRDVQRVLPRRFPYKVLYLVQSDEARVIGVVHAKRHPRVWQERV